MQQAIRQLDAIAMVALIAGEELAETHDTLDTTLVLPVHRRPESGFLTVF